MIELKDDSLHFSFPEVHRAARMSIEFQRTLRIPDDGTDYPLPPGLGRFPLRHVDDHARRLPAAWIEHGGVMLPMYQSEAMWVNFEGSYPFAVKIATGKINAVTGEGWIEGLNRDPQDYLVRPEQPWLDGYCVKRGVIRQFTAMPLGAGYSVEEQVTGAAEHGGIQILVFPMKREAYEKRQAAMLAEAQAMHEAMGAPVPCYGPPAMGLAPGGRMRQEIYDDPYDFEEWDLRHSSRCFVHICNSFVWREITGEDPPTTPPTAREYTRAGLPWFDYYAEGLTAVGGSSTLNHTKSVEEMGKTKGEIPLPENESVVPASVVELRKGLGRNQVREW